MNLKGKCIKAWIIHCAQCTKRTTYSSSQGAVIEKSIAEQWARQDGWSKKASGWTCPDCSKKHA